MGLWEPCRIVAVAVATESTSRDTMTQARSDRRWLMLLMDFAGKTTFHGVRFLVEPTKFLVRRFNNFTMGSLLKTALKFWSKRSNTITLVNMTEA